jgi:hypothetical protein
MRTDGHKEAIMHISVTLRCEGAETGLIQEYSDQDEDISGPNIMRTQQY